MPLFQPLVLQDAPKSDRLPWRVLMLPLTLTFLCSVIISVLLIQIQDNIFYERRTVAPSDWDQFDAQLEHLNLSSIASRQEIRALHDTRLDAVKNVTNYRIDGILQSLDSIFKKLERFKKRSFTDRIQTLQEDVDQRISQVKATLSERMSQMNLHLNYQSHLIVQLQEMILQQNDFNSDFHRALTNATLVHLSWEEKLVNVSTAMTDFQAKVNREMSDPRIELISMIQKTCRETVNESRQDILDEFESKMVELASNLTLDLKNVPLTRILKQNIDSGVDLQLVQSVLSQCLNTSDGIDAVMKDTLRDLRRHMNATDGMVSDLHLEQDQIHDELESLREEVQSINQTLVQPLKGHVKNFKRMEILDEVRLNFFTLNGTEYYVVKKKETFSTAKDRCAQLNGQLAEFQSQEELQKITDKTLEIGLQSWWLGLSDFATENEWRWATSRRSLDFDAWGPGEPNNANFHEDCAEVWETYLNDAHCDSLRQYVCQFPQ
ncbi:C-type lectin domain family 4 member M-like [Tigriopus californicus]|uniref:C-type lectin domain family 4 member M-like n=1 Tax=Tigriopus californicus TaxID=6832 RepID=UPI0027DA0510|nr:C-type lectin domain family 4 member M-like [Tigriopus californicus]